MSIKSSDPFPMFTWDIETGIPGEKLRATNPDNIVMYAKEDGIKLNAVKIGIFDIEFTTEPEFNQSDEMVYDFSITGTDGQAHEIASSIYHEKTGLLSFVTDHFSLYGVGYKEFVTNRGLFGGTAEGIFSPNMSMTRGMLVTVLSRLAKADLSSYTTSHFADNAQITSYAKAAVKEMQISGIISGKDINQFDPQGTATRAEVSAVLKRLINILENK